ncbi:2-aminoethylphosphonate--pyruvate transaminase-like [Penaeus japonicus]|uniref:2-aminoethylphosphonate--pyruvate transaminase-like n=1 Tax=Penaeus japonicus TaxID=27405 RepID=UPI001C7162A1|nr:2-aminoethylphosphonate--pyruvate transaminase-like [Penaeus japonicus]
MEAPFKEKKLFTPGPLCCSRSVKEAMLVDVGSRDSYFISCVKEIRQRLLEIAQLSESEYTAVPLQGSGTYCVEAVLQTTSPRQGAKVLILANGAYGRRMGQMCEWAGLEMRLEEFPEEQRLDLAKVETILRSDSFSTVAVVHCETSTGIINPVEDVARLVTSLQPGAAMVVDAMSSFGAVPLEVSGSGIDYVVSSANKCLEGVPGFSFAICRTKHLLSCKGNCRVLSLDLVDQHLALDRSGQFRFTPPTHSMLAFRQALREYASSGGLAGRASRYKENRRILREGMKRLGFRELLKEEDAGYIITSFRFPEHERFDFQVFYSKLSEKGQVIYPGKVSSANCFRVGNIGHLFPKDMTTFLGCLEDVMREVGLPVPLS